jgi:hypothetical protein
MKTGSLMIRSPLQKTQKAPMRMKRKGENLQLVNWRLGELAIALGV